MLASRSGRIQSSADYISGHSHPTGRALTSDWSANTFLKAVYHPTGRTLTSDRSANSSVIAVYENISFRFSQNCLTKVRHKFFIDNHYKIIYESVTSECSSCRVISLSLMITQLKGFGRFKVVAAFGEILLKQWHSATCCLGDYRLWNLGSATEKCPSISECVFSLRLISPH